MSSIRYVMCIFAFRSVRFCLWTRVCVLRADDFCLDYSFRREIAKSLDSLAGEDLVYIFIAAFQFKKSACLYFPIFLNLENHIECKPEIALLSGMNGPNNRHKNLMLHTHNPLLRAIFEFQKLPASIQKTPVRSSTDALPSQKSALSSSLRSNPFNKIR